MKYVCPHCGSENIAKVDGSVFCIMGNCWGTRNVKFKCFSCNHGFDKLATPVNGEECYSNPDDVVLKKKDFICPTCGSDDIVYYNKADKHHYCQNCETRW